VRDSRERETDPQTVISSLLCLASSALQRTCDTPTTKVCLQVGVENTMLFLSSGIRIPRDKAVQPIAFRVAHVQWQSQI